MKKIILTALFAFGVGSVECQESCFPGKTLDELKKASLQQIDIVWKTPEGQKLLVAGKRLRNAKKKLTELKDCCDNGDEECCMQINKYKLEYAIAKAVADMAQQELRNRYQNTQEGKLMDACMVCIAQREYEILKLS